MYILHSRNYKERLHSLSCHWLFYVISSASSHSCSSNLQLPFMPHPIYLTCNSALASCTKAEVASCQVCQEQISDFCNWLCCHVVHIKEKKRETKCGSVQIWLCLVVTEKEKPPGGSVQICQGEAKALCFSSCFNYFQWKYHSWIYNMQHILLLHYANYSVWYSSFRFLPVFWWPIPSQFWCEPTTPLCKMSNNFTDMMIGRPGTERVANTECLFCLCKTKTDCLKLVLINTIKLQW